MTIAEQVEKKKKDEERRLTCIKLALQFANIKALQLPVEPLNAQSVLKDANEFLTYLTD